MAQTKGILERVFKLSEKGTTVKTEILAGLTTFVAMAYIIFVNPSILADAGIPKEAAIAATVWSAVIGSAAMGLWANFPVAVAPGMGLNAFFAYYVCGVLGLHWTVALGAVFFSGIVFLLLTVTHVRQLLIDAVPMNLKYAIVVGIGMFIAFIGLQNAGIVVKNDATVVALGHVTFRDRQRYEFLPPEPRPHVHAARHHGRAQVRHHFDHLHLHHRRAVRQHGDAHRPLPQSPADG